jgi:hypothetical protein
MKGFIVSPPILDLDLDRSRFSTFDSAALPNAESYVIVRTPTLTDDRTHLSTSIIEMDKSVLCQ